MEEILENAAKAIRGLVCFVLGGAVVFVIFIVLGLWFGAHGSTEIEVEEIQAPVLNIANQTSIEYASKLIKCQTEIELLISAYNQKPEIELAKKIIAKQNEFIALLQKDK